MENNDGLNTRRILQIEVHPLVWEILVESGKGFDRSPNQEAKKILMEAMHEREMLPKKDTPTLIGELLYGIIKRGVENGRKET